MQVSNRDVDSRIFKFGAVSLVLGFAIANVFSYIHPHEQNPSDFPAVFAEYAASQHWVAIHMGELFGVMLVLIFGTTAIYFSLIKEASFIAVLARLGWALALVTFAVFVVLQAIDGLALKKMVDSWSAAPAPEIAAAVRIAEAIRWIEISLDSVFRGLNGGTALLLGAAMAFSTVYPKWIGWLGAIYGISEIAVSVVMGLTGTSIQVIYANFAPLVIGALWLIAVAGTLWQRADEF